MFDALMRFRVGMDELSMGLITNHCLASLTGNPGLRVVIAVFHISTLDSINIELGHFPPEHKKNLIMISYVLTQWTKVNNFIYDIVMDRCITNAYRTTFSVMRQLAFRWKFKHQANILFYHPPTLTSFYLS